MPRVARLGDAISHGGTIISASENVLTNGIGTARRGDRVHCRLHGLQVISSASASVFANNKGVARIGDRISCGAVIITGSPDVWCGG